MKTTRYRAWISRYGHVGVLMVGGVLAAHYLWTKRRPALFGTLVLLSAVFWFCIRMHHSVQAHHLAPSVSIAPPVSDPPVLIQNSIPHPSLMEHATRICSTQGWQLRREYVDGEPYMTYYWPSKNKILFFQTDRRTDVLLWQLDLKSGRKTSFRNISTLWDNDGDFKKSIKISPDGQWILWWGNFNRERRYYQGYYGARRDGARRFYIDEGYPSLTWLPDSRHFVATGKLHSVDAAKKPERLVGHWDYDEDCTGVAGDRIIRVAPDSWPPTSVSIEDNVLIGHPGISKCWRLTVPGDEEWIEWSVSPQGDRIAWIRIHGPIHSEEGAVIQTVSLSVTSLNGRLIKEIGDLRVPGSDEAVLDSWHRPYDIKWLPDGKKLSFIYRDVLYTVPAEFTQ